MIRNIPLVARHCCVSRDCFIALSRIAVLLCRLVRSYTNARYVENEQDMLKAVETQQAGCNALVVFR